MILLSSIVILNIGVLITMILIYFQLESLEELYDLVKEGELKVNVANGPLNVTNSGKCTGERCVEF